MLTRSHEQTAREFLRDAGGLGESDSPVLRIDAMLHSPSIQRQHRPAVAIATPFVGGQIHGLPMADAVPVILRGAAGGAGFAPLPEVLQAAASTSAASLRASLATPVSDLATGAGYIPASFSQGSPQDAPHVPFPMPQNFASLPPAPARTKVYTPKLTRKVNFVLVEPSSGKKAKKGEFTAVDAKGKKVTIDVPLPSPPAGTAPPSFVEQAALKNAIHGERNLTSHIPFDNLGIFVKVSAGSAFYNLIKENISFSGSTALHIGVGLIAKEGHIRPEDMEIDRLKKVKKQKVLDAGMQPGQAIPMQAFATARGSMVVCYPRNEQM